MKQFFTTFLFLTLTAFYGLTQNIQGDGGLPKTFKQTLNTKDLDTWVFETPDVPSMRRNPAHAQCVPGMRSRRSHGPGWTGG